MLGLVFVLMVESIVASAIDKALETVLRKVGEGKKLTTEDLVVLMLGLFQEIRKDVTETNKRIDAINDSLSKRIDALYDLVGKNYEALNKRIDAINDSLSRRIEETNKRIDEVNRRIDELGKGMSEMRESINKRIDTLYDLLGKIYQTLIKQETTQRR
jgi:methyl-accepting chemotaxis protein